MLELENSILNIGLKLRVELWLKIEHVEKYLKLKFLSYNLTCALSTDAFLGAITH